MQGFNLLIALQLVSLSALIGARTEHLATTAVPFQLISPAEYKAILDLNNGHPFITQNRLLTSRSQIVTDIINNIANGLINPVNITGIDPIYNSIFKPSGSGQPQGYPFCAIQTNRNSQHSARSYNAIVDPASNFGTFSINFYHPGTVNIDNYDEDISTDEFESSDYNNQRPSQSELNLPSNTIPTSNQYGSTDGNNDKPDSFGAPVINCIVVIKESPQPVTQPPTTTTTPIPAFNRPPKQPSFYPGILTPQPPRNPGVSLGSYQIVPIPYPPFLGLVGPTTGTPNWASWIGSQSYALNNPSSGFPPIWPSIWPTGSHGNKNQQNAQPWPYLTIPSQPVNPHAPTTLPFLPLNSFWPAIKPNGGNSAPSSPATSVHSNPAAWFRPPADASNANNHLMPQSNYNGNDDEIRSAAHDDVIGSENMENHDKTMNEDENADVDAVQRSQKLLPRRKGEKLGF